MAGQIAGMWRAANLPSTSGYDYATKWGNGINPIHRTRDGQGRNIAVQETQDTVDEGLTDPYAPESLGYTSEDTSPLWGYGTNTGTADRPGLGSDEQDFRVATAANWPEWGPYAGGAPGGQGIRSEDNGSAAQTTAKTSPQSENPPTGLQMKRTTHVNDPGISDPSQYVMQTSMVQLNKVRSGSQTSGRASEYDAPIASRVPGMKLPLVRNGAGRAWDMLPKAQDLIIRPFWNRTAGTGPVPWMRPNSLYQSQPYQRTPPGDPYQGPTVPDAQAAYADTNPYGYTDEDVNY